MLPGSIIPGGIISGFAPLPAAPGDSGVSERGSSLDPAHAAASDASREMETEVRRERLRADGVMDRTPRGESGNVPRTIRDVRGASQRDERISRSLRASRCTTAA
jgi:hypothetical protein